MNYLPFVTIVMTYYERLDQLRNTLRSFQIHKYNHFEVIIVDDGSTESPLTNTMFLQYDFPISIINMPCVKKYYNSCIPFNIGFEQAKGDIIIIQNAECLHLGNILDHARKYLDESNYFSYSCFSLNFTETINLNKNTDWDLIYFNNIINTHRKHTYDGDLGWYNHSKFNPRGYHFTSAITKNNLDKLAGFDRRYSQGIAFDDDEILARIKRLGLQITIVDDTTVIHQWHYNNIKNVKDNSLFLRNFLLYKLVTKNETNYRPSNKTLLFVIFKLFNPILIRLFPIIIALKRYYDTFQSNLINKRKSDIIISKGKNLK